jgi:hypothetical protein
MLTLAACGGPSPDEVRQRSSSILSEMVREAGNSIDAISQMESIRTFLDGLTAVGWGWGSGDQAGPAAGAESKASNLGASASEVAARLDETLGRYVFNESNLETTSHGSTTFLLRGSTICQGFTVSCYSASGQPTTCTSTSSSSSQAKCAEMVDRLQIRIVASLEGDGVDLELQVGPGRGVFTLQLRPGSVTLKISLASARETLAHVAQVTGEDLPDLPQLMQGVIALSLIRNAPGDLTAKLSVLQAIDVAGLGPEGSYKARTEARDPLASLRFERGAGRLTSTADWGATEVLLPTRLLFSRGSGQLQLLLQGLSSTLVASQSAGIEVKNIGLGDGPSWLKLDEKTLFEANLNAASGRRFGVDITPWQGLPRCEVDPEVDLQVKLYLAPIERWLDSPLEPWARNESYRLRLASAAGKPQVVPMRSSGTFPGGLKVLQGSLTLESFNQPAQVTVPAGACLIGRDSIPAGAHPLLGHLQSIACP